MKLDSTFSFAGETLTASGWGSVNPDSNILEPASALKATKLLGLAQNECQLLLGQSVINENAHICAVGNNTGVCKGDSGGNKIFVILVIKFFTQPT